MTEPFDFDEEEMVCSHELMVAFAQMKDGTVNWAVITDETTEVTRKAGLYWLAEAGAPLAALGIHVLRKLCEDGLIQHALEEASAARRAVRRQGATQSGELRLSAPDGSKAVH
jgi:hypothetical protein